MYNTNEKKYDSLIEDLSFSKGRRKIKFDILFFMAVLILASFGVLIIYSATRSLVPGGVTDPRYYLKRQAVFLGAGILLFSVLQFINYRKIKDLWWIPAIIGLLSLGAVLIFGYEVNGSKSWIDLGLFPIQPSEFAKIFMIITLSAILSKHRSEKSNYVSFKKVIFSGVAAVIFMVLVLLEPDFGTALIFLVIFIGMLFISGANFFYIIAALLISVGGFIGALQMGIIKQYQLDRILIFLRPEISIGGAGYNLYQSKMAIGSGGLTGKGLFLGTNTNLNYVPEHHTDFIFSVIGEELGFIGGFFVIVLLGFIIWKCFHIAFRSDNSFGRLMASGVGFMVFTQVVINIGMTIGIMPIIGIPLPFLSSGGSSLISMFFGMALVSNVYIYREERRGHEIAYDDFSDEI
ncbi:MAG TPA: rod shape-determining protein RodA [Actinobacteria bacterium]|nr:rod shape-determining protein RodA [Actinomycetota bacterium]